MRYRLPVSALLALALLALPAVAAAGPKPIKKPAAPGTTAKAPAKTPAKAPVLPVHTSSSTTTTHTASTTSTTIRKPPSTGTSTKAQLNGAGTVTPKVVFVNVIGRDQSGVAITLPPEETAPAVVAPPPTPLALVAVGDRLRSHDTPTPVWMLALLGVLAAAEAFLVVRLVRYRPAGVAVAS